MRISNANELASVTLKGFLAKHVKAVPTMPIELGPHLTVLYGRNGAGKSAVISNLRKENLLLDFKVNPDSEASVFTHRRDKTEADIQNARLNYILDYLVDEIGDYPWPNGSQDVADNSFGFFDWRISDARDSWLDWVAWLDKRGVPFPTNVLAYQLLYVTGTHYSELHSHEGLVDLVGDAVIEFASRVCLRRQDVQIEGTDPRFRSSYTHSELTAVFVDHEKSPTIAKLLEIISREEIRDSTGLYRLLACVVSQAAPSLWVFPAWRTSLPAFDTEVICEKDLSEVERIALIESEESLGNFSPFARVGDEIVVNPFLVEAADRWSARASHFYGLLLEGAPQLGFRIEDPKNLTLRQFALDGSKHARWQAKIGADDWIALDHLSTAEQRWVALAIQLTVYSFRHTYLEAVLVIDEPESHLHRRAERHLVRGLSQIAEELDIKVCVSTHSPLFLQASNSKLIHVYRELDGRTSLAAMDQPSIATIDIFAEKHGLNRSDLLQLVKWFIVVEGEHDKTLLNEWLPELSSLGAHVLSMGGIGADSSYSHGAMSDGREARPEDWQMIYRFSEANVLLLVDSVDGTSVLKLWDEVKHLKFHEADRAIRKFESNDKRLKERAWIALQIREAISGGFAHRLVPYSLKKRDIIEYLDPRLLRRDLEDDPRFKETNSDIDSCWALITKAWNDARRPMDYKSYARDIFKLSISIRSLADAARRTPAEQIPSEIRRIADLVRR